MDAMAQKPATISLCEHVDRTLVLKVASAMADSALYRQPGFLDGPEAPMDDWELLFQDHDPRLLGWGYFSHDEEERRSRRLDMRGPTDVDPGPLPMAEPEDEDSCVVLEFSRG